MHELTQPPDEPIDEGVADDGSRAEQDETVRPAHRAASEAADDDGHESKVHDALGGDGWVPA